MSAPRFYVVSACCRVPRLCLQSWFGSSPLWRLSGSRRTRLTTEPVGLVTAALRRNVGCRCVILCSSECCLQGNSSLPCADSNGCERSRQSFGNETRRSFLRRSGPAGSMQPKPNQTGRAGDLFLYPGFKPTTTPSSWS